LLLPLKNAGAGGGGFGLVDVTGLLQGDGERRVSQRIFGRENGEGHGRAYRLVELPGVAQGANEAVMGFNVIGIGGDGGAEGSSCFRGLPGSQQVKSMLRERVGGGRIGHG